MAYDKYQTVTNCVRCHATVYMYMIDTDVWIGECEACKLAFTWWPPDRPIQQSVTVLLRPISQPQEG